MRPAEIAVVEPDPRQVRTMRRLLLPEGYRLRRYRSVGRYLDSLLRGCADLLILDMNLPGMDSRELLRALRANAQTRRLPIIGLSSEPWPKDDVAAAFNAGADEFFFLPVDPALLATRVKSLLGRSREPEPEACLRCGGIAVYPDSRVCRVDDEDTRLTRLEFDILVAFLRNPRRVLTRGYLIHALWKGDGSRGARAVDRHIHSLRTKLGGHSRLLETLVGIGYRLGA